MPDRVHIIGVGSPFGDDRLGWVAAESLQRSPVLKCLEPDRIVISIMDRPGAMLLTHCREADHVIVLDAVRSGAAPGTRHRFTAGDVTASRLPVPWLRRSRRAGTRPGARKCSAPAYILRYRDERFPPRHGSKRCGRQGHADFCQ